MKRKLIFSFVLAVFAAGAVAATATTAVAKKPKSVCPGGQVRFGVEPYDTAANMEPAYTALAAALSKNLGCTVKLYITQDYVSEIEAMRNKKLDAGEFGPLGYIFAKKLAKAQPVAAFGTMDHKPVTYTAALWVPDNSPIHSVVGLRGHTIAFSSPASTSGNLFPRYALVKAGLDPDKDVKIEFAGSHPASLLALVNGKVDAAEINSQQQATATAAGQFDPSKFRTIWRSKPIPNDPITVRGDLSRAFKKAFKKALLKLSPAQLDAVDKELGVDSGPMVPVKDSLYAQIRDVVNKLHIDINHIG
jgi:phosphonate transport system substrate-binding protein